MDQRIEEVDGVVTETPAFVEYWQAVGRYSPGVGPWFCGTTLHRHKIEAESDASASGYKEKRLVRIILPA